VGLLGAVFVAILVLWAALGLAAPATANARQLPCWRSVVNDWSADGEIDHSHRLGCYRTALERLPSDIRTYTTAEDDIRRALLDAIRARPSVTKRAPAQASRSRGAASNGAPARALQGRGTGTLGATLATTAPAATSPPLRAIVAASLAFLLVVLGGLAKYRERRRTHHSAA